MLSNNINIKEEVIRLAFSNLSKYQSIENVYVLYKNHKLYAMHQENPEEIYEVKNLIEFKEEYHQRHDNRWKNFLSYQYCNRDAIRNGDYVDGVNILPGSIENFKKDFPYAPFDEYKENIDRERHRYYFRSISNNTKICNFMGMFSENPQIELMMKTGMKKFVYGWMDEPDSDKYRLAFGKGKNFQEITGMPNWLWKRLLEADVSIEKWDTLRIWNKQLLSESKKKAEAAKKAGKKVGANDIHGFDQETVDSILNLNCTDNKTLKQIKSIINKTLDENGERMFTIKTLFNYLERVDMYQAIPSYQSIEILSDYVRMCKDLEVEPRIDSDSLKREHDVCARNHNIWQEAKRAEFEAEKGVLFEERAKELEKYTDYKDDNLNLMVKVPNTIKDLIDEGRNNHNCVGSYVSMFARGTSNIFFIRHINNPDKSYITIELNGPCHDYKQAYLASNQRITNPDDWKFINDWLEHNKTLAA